ncbi:autotransporter adhesin BpaC isoform X2 [Drosophila novamexicana]|uniref:autotransporter adhesin BpaC isoform X2 n=1 Tax=Drosophila novamexicana TaxID=47314 RepID=UPI0011E5ADF1|nr:autotransporter adhesin BpaC isoform X2 [Drosophila novamexicana]
MAVFLINICKFNGCFKTFPSLGDLISHIEGTHIDYDPKVVEQKELAPPPSLPLSYVLRFISDDARKEPSIFLSNTTSSNNNNSASNTSSSGNAGNAELKRKLAIKHHSYSMSSSNRSNTPTGSEMDEDEMVVTESEDSNDSWTTEEFSSEFIMRYGSRHSGGGSNGTPGNEKPFACPVPGCKKRYKNVNGIKYHSKNGHKKDGRVRKGYKCHCGKSYKTAQGLKNHALLTHNTQPESVLTAENVIRCKPENNNSSNSSSLAGSNNAGSNNVGLLQRSNSPSQSLGSLSPSSSNMSSSTSTSCHGAVSLGSNSLSSNAATATNMLQQLSNGNIVTVTNLPQQQQQALPQQQQQQQQQMSVSTLSQSATSTTTTATETSYSCSHNNNSNSSSDSSKQLATAATATAKYNRPTAAAATAATSKTSSSATTPMQISYTFIEHKYSLGFKEKYLSNLRASRNASGAASNGDQLAATAAGIGAEAATIGTVGSGSGSGSGNPTAGNMLSAVAVGQMCALQNEHIHQNLYKKTIN